MHMILGILQAGFNMSKIVQKNHLYKKKTNKTHKVIMIVFACRWQGHVWFIFPFSLF